MTTPKRLPPGVRRTEAGRYQARYSVTRLGTTRQVSAGTFDTVAEARDARAKALVELREGTWIDPAGTRTTVQQWAQEWLELQDIRDRRTESFLRVHILPHWGHRKLGDISVADVQCWVNQLHSGALAPSSAHEVYATFKRMMARAVDYDRLLKTPCRLVKEPTVYAKRLDPLLPADILALEAAAPPRYRTLVHLAAWTGLRWQECAALQWEDVDLQAGLIRIHRAVKADGAIGSTKNRKTRVVTLAPSVVAALRSHRRDFGSETYVFTGARGSRLSYSPFMQKVWRPLVEQSGVQPAPTFHKLRHAYVGLMIMAGLDPKVVSEQVGHSTVAFTMERYGWTRPDHQVVVSAAIEKMQETA